MAEVKVKICDLCLTKDNTKVVAEYVCIRCGADMCHGCSSSICIDLKILDDSILLIRNERICNKCRDIIAENKIGVSNRLRHDSELSTLIVGIMREFKAKEGL